MSAPFHAFHWPDHVIGKRESRRIRDDHNALFNSHAELLTLLHSAASWNASDAKLGLPTLSHLAERARVIREAIAKAEGAR